MEYKQNGTKLLIEALSDDKSKIETYKIGSTSGLILSLQVSGDIQKYDYVEAGLYTDVNAPLCAYGPFVKSLIPLSKFLMSLGMVNVGIYHPKHQSSFAHVSYWADNRKEKEVVLDLQETVKYWKQFLPDQKSIELKLMLSGSTGADKTTYMRDVKVVDLLLSDFADLNLKVDYKGDIGAGVVDLKINEGVKLSEFISVFHQKIEKPETYTIQGGVPPNRKNISVSYQYKINGQRIQDKSLLLSNFNFKENDTILIEVGGGGKVD